MAPVMGAAHREYSILKNDLKRGVFNLIGWIEKGCNSGNPPTTQGIVSDPQYSRKWDLGNKRELINKVCIIELNFTYIPVDEQQFIQLDGFHL